MSKGQGQLFGGDWTEAKLRAVREYLAAYVKVMKNQYYFETLYIDAFAGTGTVAIADESEPDLSLFPELANADPYLVGSARQALEVQPPFDKYIFIEQSGGYVEQLEKMTDDYPALKHRIDVVRGDANERVTRLCREWQSRQRGVLFLDPFGMQVDWSTIEAVAATQKIDMWYLFPVGAVCRCMPKDGKVQPGWEQRLDAVLGTPEWRDLFYGVSKRQTLLGEESCMERTATYRDVCAFFTQRLKATFADAVAANEPLCNERKSPMFLLFFAVANPSARAQEIATRIARSILETKD